MKCKLLVHLKRRHWPSIASVHRKCAEASLSIRFFKVCFVLYTPQVVPCNGIEMTEDHWTWWNIFRRIAISCNFFHTSNFSNEMLQRHCLKPFCLVTKRTHLNGQWTNKARYWATQNPRQKHVQPLHSPKVIVRVAISGEGFIGTYFLRPSGVSTYGKQWTALRHVKELFGPTIAGDWRF